MIVDDEPIILQGIREMIEDAHTLFNTIVTANDAIEALEILDYFNPDLVITDIHMPEMSGLEFIEQAKKKNVSKFIVLTGYDVFEYAKQAIKLQVVDYLLKPVDEYELEQLLKKIALELTIPSEKRVLEQDGDSKETYENVDPHNENIAFMKAFIEHQYMDNIAITDVGNQLNMNPAYLGQLFKKETGSSFTSYLNQVRVERAKELLLRSELISLKRIANCVGYENERTFYKIFRKYENCTPGEYRKSKVENDSFT